MAEKIIEYEVDIGFDTAVKKMANLQKKMAKFDKAQISSLKVQIALQRQLNRLRNNRGNGTRGNGNATPPIPPTTANPPTTGRGRNRISNVDAARRAADEENTSRSARVSGRNNLSAQRATAVQGRRDEIEAARALVREQETIERLMSRTNQESRRSITNRRQAVAAVRRTAMWMEEARTESERIARAAFQQRVQSARTANQVRDVVALERQRLRDLRRQERVLRRQSFFMSRMQSSSRSMAGNMMTAFAFAAGGNFVAQTGAAFQAVDNGLLVVSSSAEAAGESLAFVRREAFRLGKPLKDSAKSFVRMKAAQGDISDDDLKTIFLGVMEMSTVLGLTADEANRANVAIGQMMSKGKVTAEELKNQLAESGIANAIPEMVKAAQDIGLIDKSLSLTKATAAFAKLQEQGKVLSEEILPRFGERLREAAGKGLDGALKGYNVAFGRLKFSIEDAANTMFKAGFGEGLTGLLNEIALFVRDMAPLWKGLGKILGGIFNMISKVIAFVKPAFLAIGSIIKQVSGLFDETTVGIMGMGGALGILARFANPLSKMVSIMAMFALTIEQSLFWLEELINLYTGELDGLLRSKDQSGAEALVALMTPDMDLSYLKDVEAFSKKIFPAWVAPDRGAGGAQPTTIIMKVNEEVLATVVANSDIMADSMSSHFEYNIGS